MSEFREFWIYRNEEYAPTYACDFNQRGFVPERNRESIHVIEYSAYEELKQMRSQDQTSIEAKDHEIVKLKAKLEVAKAALKLIADDYASENAIYASEALKEIEGNNE